MEEGACKQGASYRGLWIPLGTLLPGGCKAPAQRNERNGLTCPSPSRPPLSLALPVGWPCDPPYRPSPSCGHVAASCTPCETPITPPLPVRWPCGSGTRALRWLSPRTVTWL